MLLVSAHRAFFRRAQPGPDSNALSRLPSLLPSLRCWLALSESLCPALCATPSGFQCCSSIGSQHHSLFIYRFFFAPFACLLACLGLGVLACACPLSWALSL